MRYWFDTEFIEDGKTIDLISIGIVAEDGREMYWENTEVDLSKANDWVKENVLPHLGDVREIDRTARVSRDTIRAELWLFCDPIQYGKPEFWAYYADYDWVVLCQLFGRMIDLPDGWPMYCRDIKQEADRLEEWIRWFNSAPEYKLVLPKHDATEHHALADARWNRQAWEFLRPGAGALR